MSITALLLTIHVLAGILLIGPVTVAASLFPPAAQAARARGTRQPAAPGSALATLRRITQVYALAAVSVPVFGLATALRMDVLRQSWVLASVALTVAAAALLGVVAHRQVQLIAAFELPDRREQVDRLCGQLRALTGLFALTWVIVVVLMIIRPGSTTGV